jgi:ribosomal-protein-alanine N-acetyltransferase
MIRKYAPGDKPEIEHLYRDAKYPEPTLSYFEDKRYEPFVHSEEGKILGAIMVQDAFQNLSIKDLYVDKDFRRKGIGQKLIRYIERYARRENYKGLRVDANTENEQAHEFYKEMGFERVGKVRNYGVIGETQVFFWKRV